jgi:hypothetical protein
MLQRRRIPRSLTAVAVFAAACGREEGPARAPAEAGTPVTVTAAPTSTPVSRDACTLITKPEAEAILGVTVTPTPRDADPGQSMCYYDARENPGFGLTVRWSGGTHELDLIRKTNPAAGGMMKESGMHAPTVNAIMALEPVESLGDEAYFNMRESYARKGDVLLDFLLQEMVLSQISTGHAEPPAGLREKWTALARKALARL